MTAARIGDIGIFAVDCELFNDRGEAIKKQAPFKGTFVFQLDLGSIGDRAEDGRSVVLLRCVRERVVGEGRGTS